jgi:hypothetical protein
MTNRKYVLRSTSHSLEDSECKLSQDQGLIILLEAVKYVQRNKTERIRYTTLKLLCNEKLAYLTRNRETDFGGKFENYLVKLESKEDPSKRFLVREKIRRKESYIIPTVEKIKQLFAKYNISDLLDEELVPYKIKGPIIENRYPKATLLQRSGILLQGGIMLGPFGDQNGSESTEPSYADSPHKLYSICYFYENGDPVFVNGFEDQNEEDHMPFYEDKSRYQSVSFE